MHGLGCDEDKHGSSFRSLVVRARELPAVPTWIARLTLLTPCQGRCWVTISLRQQRGGSAHSLSSSRGTPYPLGALQIDAQSRTDCR